MSALTHHPPPPRTPSPKIRIHRSQSFDSPSSRISVTPIDDSPYSKSASAISAKPFPLPLPLPSCTLLHTKMSDDSIMSDASSMSSESQMESEGESESESESDGDGNGEGRGRYGLFGSGSPVYGMAASGEMVEDSPSSSSSSSSASPSSNLSISPQSHLSTSSDHHPRILSSSIRLLQFQEASTPMFDPWLVRMVLDMFDVRGFDWMSIADPILRTWGVRTCSAEVLEILVGNGRVRRVWWE